MQISQIKLACPCALNRDFFCNVLLCTATWHTHPNSKRNTLKCCQAPWRCNVASDICSRRCHWRTTGPAPPRIRLWYIWGLRKVLPEKNTRSFGLCPNWGGAIPSFYYNRSTTNFTRGPSQKDLPLSLHHMQENITMICATVKLLANLDQLWTSRIFWSCNHKSLVARCMFLVTGPMK